MADTPSGRITKINPDGSFEASDWGDYHPKLIDRMVAMLRELEFAASGRLGACCPKCGVIKPKEPCFMASHAEDCTLGALLKEVGRG